MNYFSEMTTNNDYLVHHGILGQKWGIRRYQPYSDNQKKRKTLITIFGLGLYGKGVNKLSDKLLKIGLNTGIGSLGSLAAVGSTAVKASGKLLATSVSIIM